MKILDYIKSLFSPKKILGQVIDSLDLLTPIVAREIDRTKEKFNALDSLAKAQWLIDKVQAFLKEKFGLEG